MSDLTKDQVKFLAISKRYEALKEEMKELKPMMLESLEEIKVGAMFQDPETGLVYQIEVPKGGYVYYDKITYIRTKKTTEKKGDLSMKKAEEAGFTLVK